jgi:hypothetical protein
MYIIFRFFSKARGSKLHNAIIVFPVPFGADNRVNFFNLELSSI